MLKTLKKLLLILLKVTVSLSLLYWILKDIDIREVWQYARQAEIKYLAITMFFTYCSYIFLALRCQTLCRPQNINMSIFSLLKGILCGLAINQVMPTSAGGDVYRMYDIYRTSQSTRSQAFTVILIDRFVGLAPLIVIGILSALFSTELNRVAPAILWSLIALLPIPWIILCIVFRKNSTHYPWISRLINYWPLSLLKKPITLADTTLAPFKGKKRLAAKSLLLAIGGQIMNVFGVAFIALATNIDLPVHVLLLSIVVLNLILVLPISINGLGVREAGIVYLFAIYGISETAALAFAWVWFALYLFEGMVGLLVLLYRHKKRNPRLAD